MASLPEVAGIRRDDIPEAPSWLDKVLLPLNRYMQQVRQALAGNLTVKENLAARWVPLEVTGGTLPKPFAAELGGRPAKAVLLASVVAPPDALTTTPVQFDWAPTTIRTAGGGYSPAVSITRLSGVVSGAKANLTFLVLAE